MKILPENKRINRFYVDIFFIILCVLVQRFIIANTIWWEFIFLSIVLYALYYHLLDNYFEIHIIENKIVVKYLFRHFCQETTYDLNKITNFIIDTSSSSRFGAHFTIYIDGKSAKYNHYMFPDSEWEKLIKIFNEKNIPYETIPKDLFD